MNAFDGMKLFGHNIASTFDEARHEIASIFSGLGHDIAGALKGLMNLGPSIFSGLYDAARTAVTKTVSFFQGLPGQDKGRLLGRRVLAGIGRQLRHHRVRQGG